ncbi:MAG TPA: hypothetical protein VIH57_24945, partial [Bacteroidales bacterium]
MKHLQGFLLLVFCLCNFLLNGTAQQGTPSNSKSSGEKSSFKLFFEKVYLHFDRQVYSSGDDIWFKAYLVNGQGNWL